MATLEVNAAHTDAIGNVVEVAILAAQRLRVTVLPVRPAIYYAAGETSGSVRTNIFTAGLP